MMIDRQLEIEKLRNEAIQLHRAGCVTFDELDEFSANARRLLYANPQSAHCCRLIDILNRRFAHRAIAQQNDELRALVSRARELAAKIGEAEKRENEARDLMHDGGPMMPWEEKGPLIKRCGQACNEAREARRELLAMFAEGK